VQWPCHQDASIRHERVLTPEANKYGSARNIYGTKQQGKALLISLAERKIVPRFSQNANENLF
jgi:hypothetical protein